MRFSQFMASAAVLVSVALLDVAAIAENPNAVDTRVPLTGAMEASVFPYGIRQGFSLLGDTKGKKCHFTVSVSVNGQGRYDQKFANPIVAPLPWTSPDLQYPSSDGGTWSLLVQALDTAPGNACKGQVTLSFAVTPETGKLTGITASAKVVATNQKISFRVSGKNYGTCKYKGTLSRGGVELVHADIDTLPFEYTTAFPDAGDYLSTADQIDDKPGAPEGCSGHLKLTFSVIPRPQCPAANEYYQSADDNEFGCLYLVRAGGRVLALAYACPSDYDKFASSGPSGDQYGCRRKSSGILDLGVVNSLLGGAQVNPSMALGGNSGNSGPQPDKPTITGVQTIPGTSPRPNTSIYYAGEDLGVDVAGNLPNNAGYGNLCGYLIEVANTSTGKIVESTQRHYYSWGAQDVGPIPDAGNYRVTVSPFKEPNLGPPACLGKGVANITVYPKAAWVTGFQLTGFGHHFYGGTSGSAWSGQWCQNCDSIFSPAHDSAFMEFNPTIKGITSGGQCAYNVTFNGHSFGGNNSMNLGSAQEVVYQNGQPGLPANQPNLYLGYNPYWSQWTDNSNTAQVIVTPGGDLVIPPCNILGGKISKTITFTNNQNAKAVVVSAP